MERVWLIETTVGTFRTSRGVSSKLDAIPQRKSGGFDRRFRAARLAERYIRWIDRAVTKEWEAGGGLYASPAGEAEAREEHEFFVRELEASAIK